MGMLPNENVPRYYVVKGHGSTFAVQEKITLPDNTIKRKHLVCKTNTVPTS